MIQRIAIKGEPNPEEQAAILALLKQREQTEAKARDVQNKNVPTLDLWQSAARSEQLNRWSASFGDSHWHR